MRKSLIIFILLLGCTPITNNNKNIAIRPSEPINKLKDDIKPTPKPSVTQIPTTDIKSNKYQFPISFSYYSCDKVYKKFRFEENGYVYFDSQIHNQVFTRTIHEGYLEELINLFNKTDIYSKTDKYKPHLNCSENIKELNFVVNSENVSFKYKSSSSDNIDFLNALNQIEKKLTEYVNLSSTTKNYNYSLPLKLDNIQYECQSTNYRYSYITIYRKEDKIILDYYPKSFWHSNLEPFPQENNPESVKNGFIKYIIQITEQDLSRIMNLINLDNPASKYELLYPSNPDYGVLPMCIPLKQNLIIRVNNVEKEYYSDAISRIEDIVKLLIKDILMENSYSEISDFVGGTKGYLDGIGLDAKFESLNDISIDKDGNIFIADKTRIRKVTPDGNVTTIIENNNFNDLNSISVDNLGNIYISESSKVFKIDEKKNIITLNGNFDSIRDIYASKNGVYVAEPYTIKYSEQYNNYIFIGTKKGYNDDIMTNARFNDITEINFANHNESIYITDSNKIRKILHGNVKTILDNTYKGYVDEKVFYSRFNSIGASFKDNSENLFIIDPINNSIRRLSKDGIVSTVIKDTSINENISKIILDKDENIYLIDAKNYKIRKASKKK